MYIICIFTEFFVKTNHLYYDTNQIPTAEQAAPHPDTPTRVWELSDRERQIIAELNHKDNESPCAVP